MDSLTRLLAELVAIPSVNPMGRSVTGPQFLETRLTDYLARFFSDLGVRYERHPVSRDRDNVLAFYEAPGSSRVILFDVHQDTVPVDGMTVPAFEPTIGDGRMYGRGTCDVKGSMAAMLAAFERLVANSRRDRRQCVACTVDEEFTPHGIVGARGDEAWGRAGDRRRADFAQHRSRTRARYAGRSARWEKRVIARRRTLA